jgi:hypothetical protein
MAPHAGVPRQPPEAEGYREPRSVLPSVDLGLGIAGGRADHDELGLRHRGGPQFVSSMGITSSYPVVAETICLASLNN